MSKRRACLDPSSVNMLFFLQKTLSRQYFCVRIFLFINTLIPLINYVSYRNTIIHYRDIFKTIERDSDSRTIVSTKLYSSHI